MFCSVAVHLYNLISLYLLLHVIMTKIPFFQKAECKKSNLFFWKKLKPEMKMEKVSKSVE